MTHEELQLLCIALGTGGSLACCLFYWLGWDHGSKHQHRLSAERFKKFMQDVKIKFS